MGISTRAAALLLLAGIACSTGGDLSVEPGASGSDRTGLEGTVRRGPIQPVCRVEESCDAPWHASFVLQQDGRVVRRFVSDSTGHFLVYAPSGTYLVVPEQTIGIGAQTPEVQVGADGLTHVDLLFDTGIR